MIEANLYPIVNQKTVCSSKTPCKVVWGDDGIAPSLLELPNINVKLMTGPNSNQIEVMDLGTFPPAKGKVVYKIPANLGPAGKYYFYKFIAGAVQVWSTRFTIKDVNGKIVGFDPETVDAKGETIAPKGKVNNNVGTMDNSTNTNAAEPKSVETNAASHTNGVNVGLSMIGMAAVSVSYLYY
ncbi:4978_t:CDS:1 [Funneliformis geosporum]|uniref:19338_t:CDS:1 n=1 Tax=Funneliformis geosporum TaxID=1117311 RepID=A0A9W4SJ89_9GLOM|nr:4978_t:CDS:1 [Funneliformis geosporum]CAI2171554.1 19338_t:CDS:1 [Funneliformis geosporum]